MKKILSYLAIFVVSIFLMGLAFEWIVPASMAHAASETQPRLSNASSSEKDVVPPAHPAQPAVFVVTVLVCILFGIIAISPLLFDDPTRLLRETDQDEL